MKTFSPLLVLLAAAPVAAQNAPGKAVAAFSPKSCDEPGKALEGVSFELTVPKAAAPIKLVYADCSWEGRNDYLPGYTERYYKGTDGYSLTLVTDHGDGAYAHDDSASDVLVARGKDWVARFGTVGNDKVVSGDALKAGDYALRAAVKAKGLPAVPQCEAHLPKPIYGPVSLMLLTKTKAYYYHEDCDICAELDSCDVATGKIKEEIVAHSVSCEDAKALAKGQEIVYDGCNQGYR